jgi:hypothetical protein
MTTASSQEIRITAIHRAEIDIERLAAAVIEFVLARRAERAREVDEREEARDV